VIIYHKQETLAGFFYVFILVAICSGDFKLEFRQTVRHKVLSLHTF
jgi:hypothetical protein